MAKIILFKNTTAFPIELPDIGETIPSSLGSPLLTLNLSHLPAVTFRRIANLENLITIGDIVINDGTNDLEAEVAILFVSDDVIADEDGFWFANRRRFGFKLNQTAHGYLPGIVLNIDIMGVISRADPVSITVSTTSFVVTEIIDNDNFYATGFGGICIPDASSLDDGLPLEVGRAYFLSLSNPGQLTLTLPTQNKNVVKLVALATSTTELLIFNYPGYTNQTK